MLKFDINLMNEVGVIPTRSRHCNSAKHLSQNSLEPYSYE